MKWLIILLVFFTVNLSAQSYVKVADKAEYQKYLAYCNYPISIPVEVTGKLTVLLVNGLYADSIGNYVAKKPITITWMPVGTKSITFEPNQREIVLEFEVLVKRRTPSIPDFYKNWKSNFIQEGLLDERSGAY